MKWSPLGNREGQDPSGTHTSGLVARLKPYGFATLGVVAATLIEVAFIDVFEDVPLFFYWPIVILIGWIGGFGPGLVAAVLSIIFTNYFILPTRYTITARMIDLIVLVMFAAITVFMSWLRQHEQRSQALISRQQLEMQITLSSIGDGVIVINTRGKITFMNPVAAALTGWTQAEAEGQDVTDVFRVVNEDTLKPTTVPVFQALEQGTVIGLENHTLLLSRTSEAWPISDSGAPIRDLSGHIIGAVLVFRDISESRQRERALETSEARYRNLVDNATDIIYTLDMDGHITSVNPVAERILGYPAAELLSMSLEDLVADVDLPKTLEMRDRKLAGEEKTVYELDIITKDLSRRTLEVSSQLTGDSQSPSGIEGIARDITIRKETERRIRILHDISAALARAITLEEVTSVIIDQALKALGAHHGAVGLVMQDGKNLELLRLTNLTEDEFKHYQYTPMDTPGPITDAIRADKPIWIESQEQYLAQYPQYADVVQNVTKTQAAAALPLRIRLHVIGGMIISFPERRQLTSGEKAFLETIADYCAQSIERAQLYEAERQARKLLQTRVLQQYVIARIGQQALTEMDIPALMERVVERLAEILEVDYVKILELIPDENKLLLKAGVGWKAGLVGQAMVSAGPESQAGYTLDSSEPVIVEDLPTETRFNGSPLLFDHHVVSGMSVVIQGYLKPYGVLGAHTGSRRRFTQDDVYFLQSVANILGAALERAHLDSMLDAQRLWLTNIIDTVPGVIWENQHEDDQEEMKLVFISAYVETMLGYTVEEALGDPHFWYKIFHPEDAQETADRFNRVRKSGRSGEVNFRAVHKDGHSIDVQALMTTILEDGKPLGKRGVMMDVSERQHLMNVQARYASLLRRSNDELRQFAYVASHDLQEPLRMVTSYMQLLENRYADKLDTDAREFIGFAVDGAARMRELINALLTYSRLDSKEQDFEEFDSQVALDKARDNLLLPIEETGAQITYDKMPRIKADPLQITQLLQNLIGNAIKFRREEMPQIHIGVERKHQEWQFAVRDNGIGIEADSLDRIFAIFQRLHAKQDYPGTGIGLAICKKVIERHGGRIWVKSTPGEGTTFYFTIPIA